MIASLTLLLLQGHLGDAVISGKTADSEIKIRTQVRFAGAISSLTWRGMEFIDATDHGRELQSASNFDAGSPILPETFNPTEAGSASDGDGQTSASVLRHFASARNHLESTTQMAFWLRPGERSGPNLAKNISPLSNHLISRRVTIGERGHPQRIDYRVAFILPPDESHKEGVFEALTGYMPPVFNRFWRYDGPSGELKPLSDGPGEQPDPVVFSTESGDFAMGILCNDPRPHGYGRFRFSNEKVVKWNCVFRVKQPKPGATFAYRMTVLVGTKAQVVSELKELVSD